MSNIILTLTLVCWFFGAFLPTKDDFPFTNKFGYGRQVAEITDPQLKRVAGMAASRTNPGFLWVHNDHGDGARFFLVDTLGHIAKTIYLKHGKNYDWEDMAVGPGPVAGKSYIYIGDIGYIDDKHGLRTDVDIYRFEEPSINSKDSVLYSFGKMTLQYPDTAHNAQALMVDPVDKGIYIITSFDSAANVYKAPNPVDFNQSMALKYMGKLPFHVVTAADISPDGSEILLKNYLAIFYWKRNPGQSLMDALLQDHEMIRYSREPHGMAMAWNANGSGFYTLSAKANKRQFLYFYPKKEN